MHVAHDNLAKGNRGGTLKVSAIVTIVLLAILVCFGSALRYQAFSESVVDKYPHGDAARFLVYAYNLKNFGVYSKSDLTLLPADTDVAVARNMLRPDGVVTPGYPMFLSRFLGGEYTEKQRDRILFAQVVLSSFTIFLIYLAFAPVSRILGLGAAALTALSPHLVNMNLFFLSEPLFCFLLIGFVWLLSFLRAGATWPLFILIGILFAMTSLTRPWIQAYLFILIPFLIFSTAQVPVKKALLIFVGAAILFTPWMIRNQTLPGTDSDPSLYVISFQHGMYPGMMYEDQAESLGYAYQFDPKSAELGTSIGKTLAELKRRAIEEPAKYLSWYLAGKAKSVLSWKMIAAADSVFVYHAQNSPYFSSPVFYLSSYYMEKIHGPLMVLAIVGLALVWLPARLQPVSQEGLLLARAMSLLVLYFLIAHSVVAPYPRYSVPIRPILYGLSLFPVFFLVQYTRRVVGKAKQRV